MTECDARQAELKKRCKSLRKRVQQNEQGVQETRSKIDRATKKQEEERILQQDKALEIKQKKLQVASEEDEYAKMIKDLERTNQYKQFLDVVCEENEGHFDEVDRILMRHESLFESQQQQSEKLLEHSDYVERRRDEFAKFCKSSGTEVVERNATIAQDRKTLDVLISETKELLIADEKIKQKQQKGIMELGEIEMAVDNLYTRCFIMDQELTKAQAQEIDRVLKLPRDAKTVQMLDRLCVFYLDMEHIAREARNHPAKPAAVAAADDPKQSPKREKKGHETTDIRQTADADAASNSGHANSAATPGTTQEVRVSAVSDATVRGVEV